MQQQQQKVTFFNGNYTLHGNFKRVQVEAPRTGRTNTQHQRKVLKALLDGAAIHHDGAKYRVRGVDLKPMHRLSVGGFLQIRHFLKAQGSRYVIDLAIVERCRPNTWIKREFSNSHG